MSLPKITIITPSYNQGEFLEDTLRSVFDQQYPNLEYFVVDGGSTDQSVEIIQRYAPRLDWWVSEKDRGQSHAINKGLERATGDIITWLNSDDFFYPGALDMVAQAYQAHPQAGLFVGNGTLANRQGERIRRYSQTVAWDYDILLRGANFVLQPATFLHRRVFDECGPIDEKITYGMDLELWLRVGNKYPVVTIDEELAAFRWYDEVKSVAGGFKEWVSMYQIVRRYTDDPITPGMVLEFFKKLKDPAVQAAAGFRDLAQFSEKTYWSMYQEMQSMLGTNDCIPRRNQGIPFVPRPRRSQTDPYSADRTSAVAPPRSSPAPLKTMTGSGSANRSGLVVDIVLPAGHSWFVREGYAEALKRHGCLGRVLYVSSWTQPGKRETELFEYLGNPQSDVIFLMDTLWHGQQVHATEAWRRRWTSCPARKILFSFECTNNPWLRPNLQWWNDARNALDRAIRCVDGFVYAHETDGELVESYGIPALFQPFAVDEAILPPLQEYARRKPRAFFKGKADKFYEDDRCYAARRRLITHLKEHASHIDVVDHYTYAEGSVLQRNQDFLRQMGDYQIIIGLPSLSPTMVVRPFEALLCGTVFLQNHIEGPRTQGIFKDGEHLCFYDAERPEELVKKVEDLLANPDRGRRIAEQGRQEVLARHTIFHRVSELLPWMAQQMGQRKASVAATGYSPQAATPTGKAVSQAVRVADARPRGRKILIDGVIFEFQKKRPAGISRVWTALLKELARSELAPDIILLDRAHTAPNIPGIVTRPALSYDLCHFDQDSIHLQNLCDREHAALFISTYYTYPEQTHSMIMLHDMIPETVGQDLSHPEWLAKERAIHKAHAYFCVSESTRDEFQKLYPDHAKRTMYLTPNAVGDEFGRATQERVASFLDQHRIEKPYFLLVGNRTLYKNAHLFFRAFSSWNEKEDFDVVCTGGGETLEECFKPYIRDIRCHVLGLSTQELAAAYAGAVALVYPSRCEGFGLPILEAHQCGCPVITCRNSALPEVAGEAAIYVGENDVKALQQAFRRVREPEVRAKLVAMGNKNVRRFSWTATGEVVRRAVEEVRAQIHALPLRPADPLNTIDRLIAAVSVDSAVAPALSPSLRVLADSFRGRMRYHRAEVAAAEDRSAKEMTKLPAHLKNCLGSTSDCDSLMAYVHGLVSEEQQELAGALAWHMLALKTVTKEYGPSFHVRLGLRLARLAVRNHRLPVAEGLINNVVLPAGLSAPHEIDLGEESKHLLGNDAQILVPTSAFSRARANLSQRAPNPAPEATPATPLVTAIVSAYNSARFLPGCIEDLEAQTLAAKLEIIVVDTHSPQNEQDIVEELQRKYPNLVYLRTDERETVYAAWNRGLKVARGKYITNANTDDRHRRDAFERMVEVLERRPEISLVYADCMVTATENETFENARPIRHFRWLDFNRHDLLQKGCFVGPQPMWRKEVHDEHGYFDESCVSAGDYEFWLRLAQTREFLHLPEVLGLYLDSPASVEHRNQAQARQEIEKARLRYQGLLRLPATGPVTASNPKSTPVAAAKPPALMPGVARLGALDTARIQCRQKQLAQSWASVTQAMAQRPYHPEAYLLLAEIALAAGDSVAARRCAEKARSLAPDWKPAKQFLKGSLRGNATHDWLILPEAIRSQGKDDRGQTKDKGCRTDARGQGIRAQSDPSMNPGSKTGAGSRLTVCLIVKNEEQFLSQCLESVKDVAWQIVVVDTGSTDRTVEIARNYGAEVHSFEWCDDFSAARNAALEHARGDWILMLDADEEMPIESREKLLQDMRSHAVMAYRLPMIHRGCEAEGASYVPRLFRNAPGLFYVGRVHEQVFPSIEVRRKSWGLDCRLGTATLLHHGYTRDMTRNRDKVRRNLRLLELALQEMPGDANLLMNYGLELVRSQRLQEALRYYWQAFDTLAGQPAQRRVPELRETLLTQMCTHLTAAKDSDGLIRALQSPLAQEHGLTASMHFALGLAYLQQKRPEEAAAELRQCLAKRNHPVLSPINPQIHRSGPRHCLALSLAAAGQAEEAEKEFRQALSEDASAMSLRIDFARFLSAAHREIEALQTLHESMLQGMNDSRIWEAGAEIALSRPEFLEFACDWTGEAVKNLPDASRLRELRAEALLLNAKPVESMRLWQEGSDQGEARAQAAMLVCQTVTGAKLELPAMADLSAVSREFIRWYQQLAALPVTNLLGRINQNLDRLSLVIPSASEKIRLALNEAQQSEISDAELAVN